MQLNRAADGSLTELPHKNIDTGAGLERILPMLQGLDSIFDTDLFLPIIDGAASICGIAYGQDEKTDVALRVMADHARAMTMLVGDGVLPANEGRGYVLRRVVRKAVLAARRLGVDKPIGPALVEVATEVLGTAWPGSGRAPRCHCQYGGSRGSRFRSHPAGRFGELGGGVRHRREGAGGRRGLHPARHPRLPGGIDRGVGP